MPENISKFVCATKVCISICPKLSSIWFPFENHRKKRNCSRIRMVISVFLLPNFFLHFWKNTQTCIFSKVNKTNLATKKTKKKHLNRWRIAQILMRGFWICIFHYCLLYILSCPPKSPEEVMTAWPPELLHCASPPLWADILEIKWLKPLTFRLGVQSGPIGLKTGQRCGYLEEITHTKFQLSSLND